MQVKAERMNTDACKKAAQKVATTLKKLQDACEGEFPETQANTVSLDEEEDSMDMMS